MGIWHDFGFVYVFILRPTLSETLLRSLTSTTNLNAMRIEVFHGFSHYHNIFGKPKVSDVLAIYVDADLLQSRTLKTSSNAAVNSFGELTSPSDLAEGG